MSTEGNVNKKGPYFFMEMVHYLNVLKREQEEAKRKSEERKLKRQADNRTRILKTAVHAVAGLIAVACLYGLMALCVLSK